MRRAGHGFGAVSAGVRAVVFALAAASALAATPTWGAEGDLAGMWLRDERLSDDPLEKLEEVSAANARGARWGASWPGAPSTTPGGRPRRGGSSDSPRGQVERLARGLQILQIEQAEGQVSIKNGNRETRVLFVDGRIAGDGLGSQTEARQHGDELVVETRSERGQMVETYRLDPGGARLTLLVELQTERLGDIQFTTVYERLDQPQKTENKAERKASPPLRATVAWEADRDEEPGEPEEESKEEPDTASDDVAGAGVVDGSLAADGEDGEARRAFAAGAVIRILPLAMPSGTQLTGKVWVQTLTIDPAVQAVEFYLDGELVTSKKLPPWDARVTLADPPREQVVRAVARAADGDVLGEDERVLNRLDPPFRVRLTGFDGDVASGSVRARAEVSVPRKARLESVVFYRGETEVARLAEGPFVADVETAGLSSQDYVRVVARLEDGRELEDVKLLDATSFSEKVDVRLVQLQVLVTDRAGYAVSGLTAEDFEITDGGKVREVERLYPSRDVALVVGLAIDSSGSMGPLWEQTRVASQQFLDATMGPKDRAFLVDFDSKIRLLQPLTGDRRELSRALDRLYPQGGTALYDSILFSMLQYDGEPGRRALVVLTDGFDSESRADPSRAVEFGQRLGVPVYVIAMVMGGGGGGAAAAAAGGFSSAALARGNLSLVTDPTGGRLFQVGSIEQVVRAYAQIQDELRNQYVLTYYTDRPPETGKPPVVEVEGKGRKVKTAVPLDLAE